MDKLDNNTRLPPAQVEMTIGKSDGTNAWSLVKTIGSSLDAPVVEIWVPAGKAAEVVSIINAAHATFTRKLITCAENDPEWEEYTQRMGYPVEQLLRRRGRPPADPNESRPVIVARYLEEHDLATTMAHFGLEAETVLSYQRKADKLTDRNSGD